MQDILGVTPRIQKMVMTLRFVPMAAVNFEISLFAFLSNLKKARVPEFYGLIIVDGSYLLIEAYRTTFSMTISAFS